MAAVVSTVRQEVFSRGGATLKETYFEPGRLCAVASLREKNHFIVSAVPIANRQENRLATGF